MPWDVLQVAGDYIGGLGGAHERAVVDRRKRHVAQPSSEVIRLLTAQIRQVPRDCVVRVRILFRMAHQVQQRACHRHLL
jgi:hypothetical protein